MESNSTFTRGRLAHPGQHYTLAMFHPHKYQNGKTCKGNIHYQKVVWQNR